MSRTAMLVIAGLVAAGCVVAWLPAQESSRRTASKYRPGSDYTPPPSEPALAPIVSPAAVAPTAATPPNRLPTGNLEEQLQASAAAVAQELSGEAPSEPSSFVPPADLPPATLPPAPSAYAPSPFPPSEGAAAAGEPAAAREESFQQPDENGELRSVLKRNRPPIVASQPAAEASVAAPQPAWPAPSAESSRRANSPAYVPARGAPAARLSTSRSITDVAVAGHSPALRVEVAGPQAVTAGKPATYVVQVANESATAADEVTLRLALPGHVRLTGSQPSQGEAALQPSADGNTRLIWSLPQIAPRSQQQMRFAVVTMEGEAFDLGVEWTCKPATVRAAIVVKQPKLELSLAGPADMTFGEEKTFTLTVSNPGNGDAERVVVHVASGAAPAQPIDIGTIPAGTKKEVPLAVVASLPGEMELRASAAGEGGLAAQTAGKIMVRKAEIAIAMEGPPLKFAGTEAIYSVTVANQGTAPADGVNLALTMPAGAKFLGGIDGAVAAGGTLKWKLASLPAGTERTYEIRLQLASAGQNRVVTVAQSAAGESATAELVTEVEAVSDLKLVVNDPAGPVATGEQAVYELQVTNRGSQAAQHVKIIMQFGDGIEPVAFEGCEARLVPGQVLCQPLPQLGAGEQVTLRVRAKALKAGTHQFRVEVTSSDDGTRLVSEGTTRFFSETGRTNAAASTARQPIEAGTIQR
jgi:hypothetical protein